MERIVETLIYGSRWLLAPLYLGMSLAVLALTAKFFQELYHLLPHLLEVTETDLVLKILGLIDLALIGSLMIIVMFSGYENFVSDLGISEDTEKLDWLGKHDFGALKVKVAGSIVAISSIHLLKIFMELESHENTDKIMWFVLIHLTLVVSAVLMGLLERINHKNHADEAGHEQNPSHH